MVKFSVRLMIAPPLVPVKVNVAFVFGRGGLEPPPQEPIPKTMETARTATMARARVFLDPHSRPVRHPANTTGQPPKGKGR